MSLSDRRNVLALLAATGLAACGFSPVYAPGGGGEVLRGRIEATAPDTRLEFRLVSRLEERLGRASSPAYRLDYTLTTSERGIAITGSNDVTRVNLSGTADFVVIETATGTQVLAGRVSTFAAYSTTGSTVATAAAERDAEDRLMVALADQIVSQLVSRADSLT